MKRIEWVFHERQLSYVGLTEGRMSLMPVDTHYPRPQCTHPVVQLSFCNFAIILSKIIKRQLAIHMKILSAKSRYMIPNSNAQDDHNHSKTFLNILLKKSRHNIKPCPTQYKWQTRFPWICIRVYRDKPMDYDVTRRTNSSTPYSATGIGWKMDQKSGELFGQQTNMVQCQYITAENGY